MANGFTRSPKLLKGALIQFSAPMLIPIPNIIVFQYNPETMTRTLEPWSPLERQRTYDERGRSTATALADEQTNQLRQPFDPSESFSLSLELDAADALEEPGSHPIATIAGVADRISAMEMLCYPPGQGAIGGLLNVSVNVSVGAGGISASVGTGRDVVPRRDRKSTRLNSSHSQISYAVFCLKKKISSLAFPGARVRVVGLGDNGAFAS